MHAVLADNNPGCNTWNVALSYHLQSSNTYSSFAVHCILHCTQQSQSTESACISAHVPSHKACLSSHLLRHVLLVPQPNAIARLKTQAVSWSEVGYQKLHTAKYQPAAINIDVHF